jgi:small-conductance mechanosensitive channel
MTQTHLILFAAAPLIMWRVYKRVQRLTVRQKSRLWRHWFGVIFLPAALLAMSAVLLPQPGVLAILLGAAAGGAALGFAALRRMASNR